MTFSPPPGNDLSSAARTCCTLVGCWNSTITAVPPANSMPSGMPFVMKRTPPAMMMIQDSAMACQRHRRKSNFVSLKICIGLDGKRGDLLPLAQHQLEERLRDENRGKQGRHETKEQRHREAADRAGAELEQERDRNQGRNVGVEQGPEHA